MTSLTDSDRVLYAAYVVLRGGAVFYERGTHVTVKPIDESNVTSACKSARGRYTPALGYRCTSLTRKSTPLGPYRKPMPRALGGS